MAIHNPSKALCLLTGILLFSAASLSQAFSITYDTDDSGTTLTGSSPIADWHRGLELQRWNAADFGANSYLTGATIRIELGMDATFYAESTGPYASAAKLRSLTGDLSVNGSGVLDNVGGQILTDLETDWISIGPADGVIDYAGTSGFTLSGGAFSQTLTNTQALSGLTGQLAEVTGLGSFALVGDKTSRAALSGSGGSLWMGSSYQGRAFASVTYTYATRIPVPGSLLLMSSVLLFRRKSRQA